jgi:predicted Zn-dependent protease with MMP-like domain
MKITRRQFDQWVAEAIELLPKKLVKGLKRLVFVVDDRPTRKLARESKLRRGYALFGCYQGYEQTERSLASQPDQISIFRKAFLEQYKTKRTIKKQVMKTVWHEISHHFGSDEAGAMRAEERMFERYAKKLGQSGMLMYKREMKKNSRLQYGRRGYKRKTKVTFRVGNN